MLFNKIQFGFVLGLVIIFIKKSFGSDYESNCKIYLNSNGENRSLKYTYQSTWSKFSAKKYGNSYDFGHFLHCQNLSTNQLPVEYCLVQYFHDFINPISVLPSKSIYFKDWNDIDISFFGSICLPNGCGTDDAREVLKDEFMAKNLSFGGIFCKNVRKPKTIFGEFSHWILSWWNFERILIFSSIFLLALILSFTNLSNFKPINIIKDLFTYNAKTSSTAYLNGIKAISTIIIILFHCWASRCYFPFKNGKDFDKFINGIFYRPLWLGNIVMENFFLVGGILAAMGLSKGFGDSNKLKWIIKYYIKRKMRLLPVTALIIVTIITSNAEFYAPFSFADEKENCKKFWWMTLTYNFLDPKHYFARYIWFISVYMQLTLAAPFIYWFISFKNYEAFSSVFVVTVSAVLRYFHTSKGFYDKAASMMNINISVSDDFFTKLIATQYRLLPFFSGMILGKYLNQKLEKFQITVNIVLTIFFFNFAIMTLSAFYVPVLFPVLEVILVLNLILLYYAFHHDSGLTTSFLSHKFWVPVSKAGLSAYLVVSYFQFGIHERMLEPQEIQNEFQFMIEFGKDVVQSFVPVLVVYTMVEEPFSRFGDYLARKI